MVGSRNRYRTHDICTCVQFIKKKIDLFFLSATLARFFNSEISFLCATELSYAQGYLCVLNKKI